jgi:cold shock CspA family protein
MNKPNVPPMPIPLQVTSRGLELPKTAEAWVQAEVAKLERFYPRIMGCRVAVEKLHRHHKAGGLFHVRIDLTLPGGELVIKHEPTLISRARKLGETAIRKHSEAGTPHKNLRLAICDAFKAAGRRLEDYARRQRGDTKRHEPSSVGRVTRLSREEGYGFLAAEDGREIYFHQNSVLHRAFHRLKTGMKVIFVEEQGEKGLQASTVRVLPGQGLRTRNQQSAA